MGDNMTNDNGWAEYRRLVLENIEDDKTFKKEVRRDISYIKGEIKVLKVKSGVWGFLAGAIPGCIALLYFLIKMLNSS